MEKLEQSVKRAQLMVDSWIPKDYQEQQQQIKHPQLYKQTAKNNKLRGKLVTQRKDTRQKRKIVEDDLQLKPSKKPTNLLLDYLKK